MRNRKKTERSFFNRHGHELKDGDEPAREIKGIKMESSVFQRVYHNRGETAHKQSLKQRATLYLILSALCLL